jgi:methionyl-tRNA formyltransferase
MSSNTNLKKVILMGKKAGACQALRWLLEKGIEVPFVVADQNEHISPNLSNVAAEYGIPIIQDENDLYKLISHNSPLVDNIDLVVSYLYWRKIKKPLIELPRLGCINFHPAPLPDYKSRAGYNTAILDKRNDFGVSAHFIDSEEFDAGPIIDVLRFPFDHEIETAHSLEATSQLRLFELFTKTMATFINDAPIKTTKNIGGLYLTSKQLEDLKIIDPEKDSLNDIDRKARAFFFPPYTGAKLIIHGHEFTVVNQAVLDYIHKLLTSKQ